MEKLHLTEEEISLIVFALNMRINYIETGNVSMNANDVTEAGFGKINALSISQMETIIAHTNLIRKLEQK